MFVQNTFSQNLYNVGTTNFTSNHPVTKPMQQDTFNGKVVSNKKVNYFKYVKNNIKNSLIDIDKEDAKRLTTLPLDKFLDEATDAIIKKKGYPAEILPEIFVAPFGGEKKKFDMFYSPSTNELYINSNSNIKSDALTYALLCHEYEHFNQMLQVYRTENLGEKAVDRFANNQAEYTVKYLLDNYKDVKVEELPQLKDKLEGNYNDIQEYVKIRDKGQDKIDEWIANTTKKEKEQLKNKLGKIREKAIEKYGIIPEHSREGKDAQKFFDGFNKKTGLNLTSLHEFYAYSSQRLNAKDFLEKIKE